MGNPDQNDLDLEALAAAISKAEEQEEQALQKLLAAMEDPAMRIFRDVENNE